MLGGMAAVGTFGSITLAVNTPVQITPPGPGHYVVQILNSAGGKLFISESNTAGANATSFLVPSGLYSPALSASGPIWIASDTAGPVSVYCAPAR
jgi:hypothetical protein